MITAAGLPGSGTDGTSPGSQMAARPSPTTTTMRTHWSTSSGPTARGRRVAGSALRARMTAPIGSVAAPVSATTPFMPTTKPGLATPSTTSSDAIT